MPNNKVKLTNQVRVLRAKRNLTQEELAQKVGVSRQTIIAIEANKYSPSLTLAFLIAHELGSNLEEIFQINILN